MERRPPDRREHEHGDDHHDQEKAGPAAHVQARIELRALGHELVVGLVAGDRLVLGAVVLEHAAQVAHVRDRPQVAEEDRDPDRLLDEDEQDRVADLVLPEVRDRDRQDEEEADGEDDREKDREAPGALADLLVGLVELGVRRDAE